MGEYYYFSEWRKENGYKSWDEFYNDQLIEGTDEDEIREAYEGIVSEFYDYCEDNDLEDYDDRYDELM